MIFDNPILVLVPTLNIVPKYSCHQSAHIVYDLYQLTQSIVLHAFALLFMPLHCSSCFCIALHAFALLFMLLHITLLAFNTNHSQTVISQPTKIRILHAHPALCDFLTLCTVSVIVFVNIIDSISIKPTLLTCQVKKPNYNPHHHYAFSQTSHHGAKSWAEL